MNIDTRSSPEDQVHRWMEESELLTTAGRRTTPENWGSYALVLAMEAERLGDPLCEGEEAAGVTSPRLGDTLMATPTNGAGGGN